MTAMTESYQSACDTLVFTRDSLRDALKSASAIEGLVLIPLIGRCAELLRDVQALAGAKEQDRF